MSYSSNDSVSSIRHSSSLPSSRASSQKDGSRSSSPSSSSPSRSSTPSGQFVKARPATPHSGTPDTTTAELPPQPKHASSRSSRALPPQHVPRTTLKSSAVKVGAGGVCDLSSRVFTDNETMLMCHALGSARGVLEVDFSLSVFPRACGPLILNALRMNPTPIQTALLDGCSLSSNWKAQIQNQVAANRQRALRRAAAQELASSAAADKSFTAAAKAGSQHLLDFFKQSMKRLQADEHGEWRELASAADRSLSAVKDALHHQTIGAKFDMYNAMLVEREAASRRAIEVDALQESYAECLLAVCREHERVLSAKASQESRHLWKRFGSGFTIAVTHTRARLTERRVDAAEVYAQALSGRIPIVQEQAASRASITGSFNEGRAKIRQRDLERVHKEDEKRRKLRHALRDEGQALDHSWMRRKFADEDAGSHTFHAAALGEDVPNFAVLRDEIALEEDDFRKQISTFETSVFRNIMQVRKFYDRLASARRRVSEVSKLYWSCLHEAPSIHFRVPPSAEGCTLFERTSPFVVIEPEAGLSVTVGALWPVRMSLLRNDLLKWLPQLRSVRQEVGPLILTILLQVTKDYRLAGAGDAQWVADMKADVRDAPDYTAVEETLHVTTNEIQTTKERLFIGEVTFTLPEELRSIGRLGFGVPTLPAASLDEVCASPDVTPLASMHHEVLAASGRIPQDEPERKPPLPLPHWGIRVAIDGNSLCVTIPTGASPEMVEAHLKQVVFVPVWSSYYDAYSSQRCLQPGEAANLLPDKHCSRRRSLCPRRTEAMRAGTTPLINAPLVAPISISLKLFTLKKRRFGVSAFSADQTPHSKLDKQEALPQLMKSYVSLAKAGPKGRGGAGSRAVSNLTSPNQTITSSPHSPSRKKYCFPSCQLTEKSVVVNIVVLPEPVSVAAAKGSRHDAKSGPWQLVPPGSLRLCEPPCLVRARTQVSLVPGHETALPALSNSASISAYLLAQNVAHGLEEGEASANTSLHSARRWCDAFFDPAAPPAPLYALPERSVLGGLNVRVRFPQRSTVPMEDEVSLVPGVDQVPFVDVGEDAIYMTPDWGALPAIKALVDGDPHKWLTAHSVRVRVAVLSFVGGEMSITFEDVPLVTASVVRATLSTLVYRNNSVDPTYGLRKVALEMTNTRFFVHHTTTIELDVYAADDPPEIENAMARMFTAPSVDDEDVRGVVGSDGCISLESLGWTLPSAPRDVFGHVRIVDDDTAFFSGGHLKMVLKGADGQLSTVSGIGLYLDVPTISLQDVVPTKGLVVALPASSFPAQGAISPSLPRPSKEWLTKISEARAIAGPKVQRPKPSPMPSLTTVRDTFPAAFAKYSALSALFEVSDNDNEDLPPLVVPAILPATTAMCGQREGVLYDDGVHIGDIVFGENLGDSAQDLTSSVVVNFVVGCAATLDGVQELLRRVRYIRSDRPKRWLMEQRRMSGSMLEYRAYVEARPQDDALLLTASLEFLPGPTAGRKDVEGKDVPGEPCTEPLLAEVHIEHTPVALVRTKAASAQGPLVVDATTPVFPFLGTLEFNGADGLGGGWLRVEMVSGVEDGDQLQLMPSSVTARLVPSSPTKSSPKGGDQTHDGGTHHIHIDAGLHRLPMYRRGHRQMDADTEQLLTLKAFMRRFLAASDVLSASQSLGESYVLSERSMSLFHTLLLSASANRSSRSCAHIGFDPLSLAYGGPPSVETEIQWAMRCRKIHLFRAQSGVSTGGHLGLVEKACHCLLEDHKDFLRRRGLAGFVGLAGDVFPFVAQVDDLFWLPSDVDGSAEELHRLETQDAPLARLYTVVGPTPTRPQRQQVALPDATTTSATLAADVDLAPPTVDAFDGVAAANASNNAGDTVVVDPNFPMYAQDARVYEYEPLRLRMQGAAHFERKQRSSHQCALVISFREGAEVTADILNDLVSRVMYTTTSTFPSVPHKVLKVSLCGGGVGGEMTSSVFRHIVVPPPACPPARFSTASATLTYRSTSTEAVLLCPMAGSQKPKRKGTERTSSALSQSASPPAASTFSFEKRGSRTQVQLVSPPERMPGGIPTPSLAALRLYAAESLHVEDGDSDVGHVDWASGSIEVRLDGGSILDCLVVLPEEQQRQADERTFTFVNQRTDTARTAMARLKESREIAAQRKLGKSQRRAESSAPHAALSRSPGPFARLGGSLFHSLVRQATQLVDSDSDEKDASKQEPVVWDSWVVGGAPHWDDVERRLIATSTPSTSPGLQPLSAEEAVDASRLYVRLDTPFEVASYPHIYGDPLAVKGRDGTYGTNDVDNGEWRTVGAIQRNFNAAECEGNIDTMIQHYMSGTSKKNSLSTSRRSSSLSLSHLRNHPLEEVSTRVFHLVDEQGVIVSEAAGTITLTRTVAPPRGTVERSKSVSRILPKAKSGGSAAKPIMSISGATPPPQADIALKIAFGSATHVTTGLLRRVMGFVAFFSVDSLKWQQCQYASHDEHRGSLSAKKGEASNASSDLILHPSRMCVIKVATASVSHASGGVYEVPAVCIRCEPPPIAKQGGKVASAPSVISLRDISEPPSCPLFTLPQTSGPKDVPLIAWRGLTDRVTVSCVDVFPVRGWCAERDSIQLRLGGSPFSLSPDGAVMCGREPIARLTINSPAFLRLEFEETANAPASARLVCDASMPPEVLRAGKGIVAYPGMEPLLSGTATGSNKQGASWGRLLLLLQCLFMVTDVKDNKDRELVPTEDRVICVQMFDGFALRESITGGSCVPQHEPFQLLQRVVFLRSGEKVLF